MKLQVRWLQRGLRLPAVRVVSGMMRQMTEVNMGLMAAGIAFYSMLAMFPAMAALISLWGVFADPQVVLQELQLLQEVIPPSVYGLVEGQVQGLMDASVTLGWTSIISLLLALWSSRSGVAGLILGLNLVHGSDRRGSFWHYVFAIGITVALIGVGIVALAAVVILPLILSYFPLQGFTSVLVVLVQWGAALGAIFVGLTVVYRYGPNLSAGERPGWMTPGAVLVASLWAIVSAGFTVYLSNFSNYNQVYGSLGAAVALLLWLYISAYLVLLGASLNVQLAKLRSEDEMREELP